jgi:hypothetical protein
MIDRWIIQLLIDVGSSEDPESSDALLRLEPLRNQEGINRVGPDDWSRISSLLSTTELIALIKALTIAEEQQIKSMGGSVSSVIWTYRNLEERDPQVAIDLANWILPRTTNCYIPFQSDNHGTTTYDEYLDRCRAIGAGKEQRHQEILDEQSRAKDRKQKQFQDGLRKVEQQKIQSKERNDLIDELSNLDSVSRLTRIALDQDHPIEYFPPELVSSDRNTLDALDPEAKARLLEKLSTLRSGIFHKIYLELTKVSD